MYINTSGGHLRVVRLGIIITFLSASLNFSTINVFLIAV